MSHRPQQVKDLRPGPLSSVQAASVTRSPVGTVELSVGRIEVRYRWPFGGSSFTASSMNFAGTTSAIKRGVSEPYIR